MIDSISYAWLSMKWSLRRRLESLQLTIAWMLPRWLVCRAAVRLIAHATSGKWGTTDVSEIRAMTALKRWETPNE